MTISLRQYTTLLLDYLRPQGRKAALLAVLLLGSIGLQLLNPQILRHFIDSAMSGGRGEVLVRAALLLLAVGLTNQVLSALATYVGADVGWSATNLLRADLALHCLNLDMPFHNERTPGELIERIDGDVTALSNFFSQFVIRVLGSALLLVGALLLVMREDWRVGLVLTLYAMVAAVMMNRVRDIAVPSTMAEREASAKLFGFLEERLAGLEDIRANGGGPYTMRRFYGLIYALFHKGRAAWMMRGRIWVLLIGIFVLGDLLALGMGIYLYRAGMITLGTVYLFFQYNELLRVPLEQITQQMQELQKAGASVGRIAELRRIEPAIRDGQGAAIPYGALAVEFAHVTFAYGEHDTVLRNISFRLDAGRTLGLLGRTGSGKSTLTRLLFRLYEPAAGTVRLGGIDTRETTHTELRGRVGMVTQEVQLFHATVRDNLTFFDKEIPDERILRVIEELGLQEWYDALPQGLDTGLTAGGGGLSSGEAQLLAFTRVFLQDPGLVLLDEPSSRLDPATERLLERAMERLLRGRTALIIAHRLSTVQRADEILIMDNGRVAEHGLREALARDHTSHFYRLLQTGLERAA
ncbi:MAG: ABC transporter ATP-binding protein [Ardenticatenaceae bacterium]